MTRPLLFVGTKLITNSVKISSYLMNAAVFTLYHVSLSSLFKCHHVNLASQGYRLSRNKIMKIKIFVIFYSLIYLPTYLPSCDKKEDQNIKYSPQFFFGTNLSDVCRRKLYHKFCRTTINRKPMKFNEREREKNESESKERGKLTVTSFADYYSI